MSALQGLDPLVAAAVAALVALGLRGVGLYRVARDRKAIGDPDLLARMAPRAGFARRTLGALLLAAGAGCLAAALAAGAFDEETSSEDGARYETVVVLDASNSMLAEDVVPNRLRREQALARRMVGRLAGRVGVVYFAGSGYVLSPLTEDRAATLMFTEAVHPTHVGRGGTSLVDGLDQALSVLAGGRAGATRTIVLFSDGESTADEVARDVTLERARRAGVRIHAIGIGTAEGARIPMPAGRGDDPALPGLEGEAGAPDEAGRAGEAAGPDDGREWLRDRTGRVVVTSLDEAGLRRIATATDGLYAAGPRAADALLERMPAAGARPPVSAAALNVILLAGFLLLALEAYVVRRS